MKTLLPCLILIFFATNQAQAIKISLFPGTDTFVQRANDIVIAKCVGPVADGNKFDDGLYPVSVQIESVLKGARKPGKATIATIYPMEAGKTYLLTNGGGSALGTNFLAIPQLSVVEVPAGFRLADVQGKNVVEQVRAVFAARLKENERQRQSLDMEKKLLDKAVLKLEPDEVAQQPSIDLYGHRAVTASGLKIELIPNAKAMRQAKSIVLPVKITNRSADEIHMVLPHEWHGGEWPVTGLFASVQPAEVKKIKLHPVYLAGENPEAARSMTLAPEKSLEVTLRMDWRGTGSVIGSPLMERAGTYSVQLLLVFEISGKKQYVKGAPTMVELPPAGK